MWVNDGIRDGECKIQDGGSITISVISINQHPFPPFKIIIPLLITPHNLPLMIQQQMLDKIKHSLNLNKDDPPPKLLPQLLSIFESQDIKSSKQTIQNLKQTLNFLSEIATTNKQAIQSYISEQIKNKQLSTDPDDEKYTFQEDLAEIQTNIKDVISNFKVLQETENKIYARIEKLVGMKVDDGRSKELEGKVRVLEEEGRRKDEEIRGLKERIERGKESQSVEAELLMNAKMQTSLLSNQVKQLQEKVMRFQKQSIEKGQQLLNLQQQKKHLISMNSSNPEIQALKNQLTETEKKYSIEKSKVQQKQKEIQQSKKKIEEEKNNLISMADDLKKSEFKQQEITKKYESSKTEVRKYRQIKLEQIKKLNEEISQLKGRESKMTQEINSHKQIIKSKDQEIEKAKQGYQNAVSNTIKQNNLQQQIHNLGQNLKETLAQSSQKEAVIETLKTELEQLKDKRQSLLKILEQPVKHQIHNLEKIHKHMELLYRDYIGEVFEQGNVVGFQRKIKDIMANIMELKEDLMM